MFISLPSCEELIIHKTKTPPCSKMRPRHPDIKHTGCKMDPAINVYMREWCFCKSEYLPVKCYDETNSLYLNHVYDKHNTDSSLIPL